MTVTVNDLVLSVRRQLGDWGAALMTLDTTMTDVATTLSPASRPSSVDINQSVEVELEEMEITDVAADLTVVRASRGTTAAAHLSGSLAIVRPRFSNLVILGALIRAERVLAGYVPAKAVTTTTTIVSGTEEYAMPAGAEYVDRVELDNGSGNPRPFHFYEILDEFDPPRIRIPQGCAATGRALRLTTLGQYSEFLWGATVSDIPVKYHNFLTEYACGVLLEDEDSAITSQTVQAAGVEPKPGVNQQVGRNMQAGAFAHLEAVKPMTRIIHRSDQRVVRR